MIKQIADKETERLFTTGRSRRFEAIERMALRKLNQLDKAITLQDMSVPPGNELEALLGDRKGQHSIRINKQYRICFRWADDGVYEVEIVDYH